MCPKDADGMPNSVHRDKNTLSGAVWYTVCIELSVCLEIFRSLWYTAATIILPPRQEWIDTDQIVQVDLRFCWLHIGFIMMGLFMFSAKPPATTGSSRQALVPRSNGNSTSHPQNGSGPAAANGGRIYIQGWICPSTCIAAALWTVAMTWACVYFQHRIMC